MRHPQDHTGQALALLRAEQAYWVTDILARLYGTDRHKSVDVPGRLFVPFPVTISTFFGEGTAIYNVVDIQSLICAALIFTMMFYYPLRMIINPRYAITFWRRSVKPVFFQKKSLYILVWLMLLIVILAILCAPFESPIIAGYLMPVIFILFTLGISRLSYALISLFWAASALLLLTYNYNFLNGVESGHSLSFILSVLISFAICLLYMSRIYQRSEWLKQDWQDRALTDPLTGLPNIRALEDFLQDHPDAKVCCLRMDNLEFLSRHYGILMRVHCKRMVTTSLQPFLQKMSGFSSSRAANWCWYCWDREPLSACSIWSIS